MVLSVIEYGDIIYSGTSEGNSNKIIVTKHRGRMPQDALQVLVEHISCQILHDRGFNAKSVKTSKNVALDLLNKIGYGPIA